MTNEELAVQILRGSEELCPLLWQQVQRYLYARAGQFYKAHRTQCTRCGVELCDIEQECYCVFRQAVKYYKPDSGYKFITFLDLPFRRCCRQLLGIKREHTDPLNSSISLDTPINAEEEQSATLEELQPDPQSTAFLEKLERAAAAELIRAEVDELPERQADTVKLYYFNGLTYEAVGELLGVTYQRVGEILSEARRELRKSKELRELYNEYYKQRHGAPYALWQPEHYAAARQEREELRRAALAKSSTAADLMQELRAMLEDIRTANSHNGNLLTAAHRNN